MAVRTDAKPRRKADPSVTVTELEELLKQWFLLAESRDVNSLLATLKHEQAENGSPKKEAIVDYCTLYKLLFSRCTNGVLPGPKLELAFANCHADKKYTRPHTHWKK